jgi:uncharacterized SAM-binding protein YcdF (DUF218 family)
VKARRAQATDAIVVLGRGVRRDGSLGLIARARVDRALELFEMGVAPRIIFSGRSSLMTDEPPPITEAAAMSRYAQARGLPAAASFVEEESRDTIGNAWFVRGRWLAPNGWTSIRVVTSDFHIPRAAWLFRKVLGRDYDVAFSAASSESFGSTVALRARDESDIAAFLAQWLGQIADGDVKTMERVIREQHPGYAANPTITTTELKARVDAIAKARRSAEHRAAPAVVRRIEERLADL